VSLRGSDFEFSPFFLFFLNPNFFFCLEMRRGSPCALLHGVLGVPLVVRGNGRDSLPFSKDCLYVLPLFIFVPQVVGLLWNRTHHFRTTFSPSPATNDQSFDTSLPSLHSPYLSFHLLSKRGRPKLFGGFMIGNGYLWCRLLVVSDPPKPPSPLRDHRMRSKRLKPASNFLSTRFPPLSELSCLPRVPPRGR